MFWERKKEGTERSGDEMMEEFGANEGREQLVCRPEQ